MSCGPEHDGNHKRHGKSSASLDEFKEPFESGAPPTHSPTHTATHTPRTEAKPGTTKRRFARHCNSRLTQLLTSYQIATRCRNSVPSDSHGVRGSRVEWPLVATHDKGAGARRPGTFAPQPGAGNLFDPADRPGSRPLFCVLSPDRGW